MQKEVQITVTKRKHPSENYEEYVIIQVRTITQVSTIPADLLQATIDALKADRARLLEDVAEYDRKIAAPERAAQETGQQHQGGGSAGHE